MKRIFLLILTNVLVVALLGIVASILGVNRYITANGLNLGALLGFALIMGFGGAFISLMMSKQMAKWMTDGIRMIDNPQNSDEQWIVNTVRKFADKAQIKMPEVAIFEGEPNAFATGAFKDSALVAVSTGLLQGMTHSQAIGGGKPAKPAALAPQAQLHQFRDGHWKTAIDLRLLRQVVEAPPVVPGRTDNLQIRIRGQRVGGQGV